MFFVNNICLSVRTEQFSLQCVIMKSVKTALRSSYRNYNKIGLASCGVSCCFNLLHSYHPYHTAVATPGDAGLDFDYRYTRFLMF